MLFNELFLISQFIAVRAILHRFVRIERDPSDCCKASLMVDSVA